MAPQRPAATFLPPLPPSAAGSEADRRAFWTGKIKSSLQLDPTTTELQILSAIDRSVLLDAPAGSGKTWDRDATWEAILHGNPDDPDHQDDILNALVAGELTALSRSILRNWQVSKFVQGGPSSGMRTLGADSRADLLELVNKLAGAAADSATAAGEEIAFTAEPVPDDAVPSKDEVQPSTTGEIAQPNLTNTSTMAKIGLVAVGAAAALGIVGAVVFVRSNKLPSSHTLILSSRENRTRCLSSSSTTVRCSMLRSA
jgi:hypothetical protein